MMHIFLRLSASFGFEKLSPLYQDVFNATGSATGNAAGSSIGNATWNATGSSTGNATWNAILSEGQCNYRMLCWVWECY